MYCCHFFSHLVANVGKKGLSAVAVKWQGGRSFILRSRACDKVAVPLFTSEVNKLLPVDINLVTTTGLRFCFICGADIQKWIEENQSAFDMLVGTMRSAGEESIP
jgi:hypothetical protein